MTATFEDLGLSSTMLEAVAKLKYENPTPVQEKAIPLALEGHDIIAGAQTGTGKTAAFCLPSMDGLGHVKKHGGPLMLVVTPTRELADQIAEVCEKIARVTKHKVAKFVGGVSYNPQKDALKRGIDVLIATPGRLEDLLNQGAAHLDEVEIVVLDEADRMLDMGFMPSIERIVDACTAPHQTLLFSATIDKNVKRVAKTMLRDPEQIEIARRGETAQTVDQYVVRISQHAKSFALEMILNQYGANRVIVFARTKHRVDSCARALKRCGFKVDTVHSDRSQAQRRKALAAFEKGSVNILVATDVLARGIDVASVDYVVNYDLPMMSEDYIHRIGRTGRAGAKGFAVSLVNPETERMLKDIQKLIKKTLPELELGDFDREAVEEEAKERSKRIREEEKAEKKKSGSKDGKSAKGKKKRNEEKRSDSEREEDLDKDFKREKNSKPGRKDSGKKKRSEKRHDEVEGKHSEKNDRRNKSEHSGKKDFKNKKSFKGDRKGKKDFEDEDKSERKGKRAGKKSHYDDNYGSRNDHKGPQKGKGGKKNRYDERDQEFSSRQDRSPRKNRRNNFGRDERNPYEGRQRKGSSKPANGRSRGSYGAKKSLSTRNDSKARYNESDPFAKYRKKGKGAKSSARPGRYSSGLHR